MMELKYGDTSFPLELPPARLLAVVRPPVPKPSGSPEEIISAALDDCDGILRTFQAGERVVIVTSDITRYTGSELYLPPLVERLNARGIRDDAIEIVIALGIHRRQTAHEHAKIAGALFGRIRVVDHD